MSFGFGVGDVIAVSKLARSVWSRFRDASDQYNDIQPEAANLHLALDDIVQNFSSIEANDKQPKNLPALVKGCGDVLNDIEEYIQKNEILGTEPSSLGSKTQKVWRKLKWDAAAVDQLRKRMVANTNSLNALIISHASQLSQATNDTVQTMAKDVQRLAFNQSQQEREEILQWISPLNFASQQSELSARRQEKTGLWLLESPEFQKWEITGGSTLVCQGMPGAGKTMLTSLVVDHLQQSSSKENVAVVYIYCDYRRKDEQIPINLVASVTKQLLDHQVAIPENVLKIYQHHRSKGTRATAEEVLEMIKSAMSPMSKIYLILDALDELGNAGQVRQHLLERIRLLQTTHGFNLMTTSRHIPSLAQTFHQPLCMEIRASDEDIRKYVRGHIRVLANCVNRNVGLQETIADSITHVADGMFLLATLHMDSLKDKASVATIKKALKSLPKGLDALDRAYEGAMQRVENQWEGFRRLAKQLLGWLTYSERLMTVNEVQHALAIESGTLYLDEDNISDIDNIVGACAGLVIVDEVTQIIRLVHYTTQEYFRQNGTTILASAKQEIAISCLTYLLYEQFEDGWADEAELNKPNAELYMSVEDRLEKYPFLGYAASYWANHARSSGRQNVRDLMMHFAKDDRRISSASQVILALDNAKKHSRHLHRIMTSIMITKSSSPLSAMHLFAYVGYEDLISELLNHGYDADIKDSCQNTPLWWAASQGHYAAVEFLLSQSHVNVNNRGREYDLLRDRFQQYGPTPLGEAALRGKDLIVELLIKCADVDVNLPNGYAESPLYSAAWSGSSRILELLLTRKDIEVNSKGPGGRTPLGVAAFCGSKDIVRQLVEREDIQINALDKEGLSPLATAARKGHESVVKLLLGHANVDVNSSDDCGKTVLHHAAQGGSEKSIEILLKHGGLDVNSKDKMGLTPLAQAMIFDSAAVVKLLCSHPDVDLNPTNHKGRDVFTLVAKRKERWSKKLELEETEEAEEAEEIQEQQPRYRSRIAYLQQEISELEQSLEILRAAIEERAHDHSQISQTQP